MSHPLQGFVRCTLGLIAPAFVSCAVLLSAEAHGSTDEALGRLILKPEERELLQRAHQNDAPTSAPPRQLAGELRRRNATVARWSREPESGETREEMGAGLARIRVGQRFDARTSQLLPPAPEEPKVVRKRAPR